jgi:hypothetical protein
MDNAATILIHTVKQVQHVFLKADNLNHTQILDSLEEVEFDDLVEVREELFSHAIGRFEQQLQTAGIEEKPELAMKKRQKQRGKISQNTRTVGMDIIGLYEYCAELTDHFPKDVISGSYLDRYIKLNKNLSTNNDRDNSIPPECNGASHIVLIAHVEELKGQLTAEVKIRNELTDRLKRWRKHSMIFKLSSLCSNLLRIKILVCQMMRRIMRLI